MEKMYQTDFPGQSILFIPPVLPLDGYRALVVEQPEEQDYRTDTKYDEQP
jgi:hypothetical protein